MIIFFSYNLQIQKILTMYSPNEGEERIPAAVIRAVVERGSDRTGGALMLDAALILPVTFPFSPSDPRFPLLKLPRPFVHAFMEKI